MIKNTGFGEFDTYLALLVEGGKSPKTISRYSESGRKLINHFNITSLADLLKIKTLDYMEFYKSLKLKDNSKNAIIRDLSAFFTWLETNYISKDNDFRKVKFGNSKFYCAKREYKEVLSDEEEKLIINASRNIQEKFMVSLALLNGSRRGDLTKIKLSDIDGCRIAITGKGGKSSFLYLSDELCEMLNQYLLERKSDSEFLFYGTRGKKNCQDEGISGVSINNRVKACASRAGLDSKKVTSHLLRATKITKVALNRGTKAAQFVARHATEVTTMLYVRPNEEMRRELVLGN